LFNVLCGVAEKEDRVTGLQRDMQHTFAKQLEAAKDIGAKEAEGEAQKHLRGMRYQVEALQKERSTVVRDLAEVKQATEQRSAALAGQYEATLAQARNEFKQELGQMRLQMCQILELRSVFEKNMKNAQEDIGHWSGKARFLEQELEKLRETSGQRVQELQEAMQKSEEGHQAEKLRLQSTIAALEAAEQDKPVHTAVPVDAEAQCDLTSEGMEQLQAENASLCTKVADLEKDVQRLEQQLTFWNSQEPKTEVVPNDSHPVLLDKIRTLEEELQYEKLKSEKAVKRVDDIAFAMAQQTKEFLSKARAGVTQTSTRQVARVNKKMQFKDFTDAYNSLIGPVHPTQGPAAPQDPGRYLAEAPSQPVASNHGSAAAVSDTTAAGRFRVRRFKAS